MDFTYPKDEKWGSLTFKEVSGNLSNLKNLWRNLNFPTFNCPSVRIWCCCLAKATLFRLQARELMPGSGISWIAWFLFYLNENDALPQFQEHLQAAHILVYFLHSCFFIRFPKFNFLCRITVLERQEPPAWSARTCLKLVEGHLNCTSSTGFMAAGRRGAIRSIINAFPSEISTTTLSSSITVSQKYPKVKDHVQK